jgi:2-C-methyl-D-erythritol 4-phosphate cytidylyltransferase
LAGGKERQDSVKNGLDALGQTLDVDDIVIIHDAVRPMVSEELIDKTIDECRIHDAATLGVPVKDTLKAVSKDGWIYETPDRKHFWLSQTPQAFKKGIIFEAYKRAYEENFYGTDDAALVERIGISVRMVFGSYKNIKITTPEDIVFAEYLLKRRYKEKFMLKAEE